MDGRFGVPVEDIRAMSADLAKYGPGEVEAMSMTADRVAARPAIYERVSEDGTVLESAPARAFGRFCAVFADGYHGTGVRASANSKKPSAIELACWLSARVT